ncbi:WD repeat protein WDR3 [Oopsacas minuta]|uniref:WD repeat protein WDR3 n=1 Tax=Oopsacas minuta TaxID=111878 RepID=A0AAV7JVM4_9METZ|nr:WD repeat protein WDR3 [Oopsacas minuta]
MSHFHNTDVRCLSFSSDSELLAAGSSDGIRIWSSSTEQLLTFVCFAQPLSCCFTPGDRYVVSGTKFGMVHIIDINLSTLLQSIHFHSDSIWSIVLQPGLDVVASCSSDRSLKLLSISYNSSGPKSEKVSLEEQSSYILPEESHLMKYSPDGKFLALSLLDNTIKIFLVRTMILYLNLYGHKLPVLGFDISHDGSVLVSGSADKTIKIWGLDFGNCLHSLIAHDDAIMGIAFVPNTHLIFSSSRDGQIKLFDIDESEEIFKLSCHQACIWCMVVSHDGNTLATSSNDMSLRLWRKNTEQIHFTEEKQEEETFVNDTALVR